MSDLPNSTEARMVAYRRLLPLAVIAFLGSWVAHMVIGSGIPVDTWLLPAVPILWVATWWLTTRRILGVPTMERISLWSLAGFFLVKMGYVAWILPDPAWYDVMEFSLYLPAFFAMAYWSRPRRRAWLTSWIFLAAFLVVASPYLLGNVASGSPEGVGTTLVFLHVAIMSALMIEFLRAYGDTVFAQRLVVDNAERLATVDELTEVENRRGMERHLRTVAQEMTRTGVPYSVMVVDLDHFKRVNDTYGHNVGDDVLRELGRLLRESVRGRDRVGRWGGEEFAIVCPAASTDAAVDLAERLRNTISGMAFPGGVELTASFGVAEARSGESIEAVVGRADAALYEAKRAGRNRVRVDGEDAVRLEPVLA